MRRRLARWVSIVSENAIASPPCAGRVPALLLLAAPPTPNGYTARPVPEITCPCGSFHHRPPVLSRPNCAIDPCAAGIPWPRASMRGIVGPDLEGCDMAETALRVRIRGRVQGVGYRA